MDRFESETWLTKRVLRYGFGVLETCLSDSLDGRALGGIHSSRAAPRSRPVSSAASASPGLRPRRRARPKATPPPARRRLRQRCPEVGLGLLDGTRDRGKARGDVFGVLDFWAG